jgi:ABC-type transporter lipoprotein component MlaA
VVKAQCFESQRSCILFAVALFTMFSTLTFNTDMSAYAATYTSTRDAYLNAAKALKEATGPYKATRDAYVAATATYTKSLYE